MATKKTTIELSKDLHDAATKAAKERGLTFTHMLREALECHLLTIARIQKGYRIIQEKPGTQDRVEIHILGVSSRSREEI